MKRRTVRLMVFSGAGLAGLIAVAQAHYGRDAASQQPANGADRANAMTARNNRPAPQMAVSEVTASDADRAVEPTASAAPDVVVPATSGSPTRLTPEMGLPDRYRPESSLPPNEADVEAIGPPARLANRVTAATPIVDLASANGLADANSEPAGRQLLAMADGDAAPAAVGSRYESATPTASDRREPAVPAGLPPAAQGTAASADAIGRLPARPRDRTMQPDRPTVEPERRSDPAEPRLAPSSVPPPMGPAATRGGVPMPTAAPKARRRAENDPFQTTEPMPAVGSPTTLSVATPPGQGNAPLESAPEGTGLPGAGDLEGPQAPSLVLEKRAAAEIQVGKECTFEIHVRNTGQVPAHGVVVRDEIPQKTRLVTCQPRTAESAGGQLRWDLGTLNVGEEATIKMHLLPVAEGEVGSVATVEFQSRASVRSVVTKPELAVRMSGPHKVMVGDDVPIQIEISNPGSGAATGVILLEDVPTGLSHPAGERLELELGTIPAGQQRQLQLVMTAKQAGVITNLLTARADANLSVEAKVELEVIAPQLKIAIDGPKRRFLDRPATYTLSLENPGTAAAKDVELAAYLPKGMEFVEANNHGQYDATTHSVVWGLEELPAHERGNVQLVALPVEAGDQMLRAEGRAAQGLIDQAQRDISVEGVAAIKFEVVDLEDPVEVGGETNYEIRVVNQGSKAATQVQIVVLVPPDMKAISASGPTQHAMQADRVVFAPLRRLAPKADTTFQVKVQGLGAGDHRLKVQLVTDEIRTPVTKEESTRVYADQ